MTHPITRSLLFVLSFISLSAFNALGQSEINPSQSYKAYQQVERWIRDWEVPMFDDLEQEQDKYKVAIVTLRLDGRVLARGSSSSVQLKEHLIWDASNRAMIQANSKLAQNQDATWESYIKELANRITITLEIADELIPISQSEIELEGFGRAPGFLGIGVSKGDRLLVSGPDSMLVQGSNLSQSAMSIANKLGDDTSTLLRTPSDLVEQGFKFYRFEPVYLAQSNAHSGAIILDRGARSVSLTEISVVHVRTLADSIASHLYTRVWPGVEPYGFMGTLDPITGRSAEPFASPFEQALSAYALLRYSGSRSENRGDKSHSFARKILKDLARVELDEQAPWDDSISASMSIIALSEIPLIEILGDPDLNNLRERCLDRVEQSYSPIEGFDPELNRSSYGLITFAIVRAKKLDPKDRSKMTQAAIDRVMNQIPESMLVSQMPFLGWAIIDSQEDSESQMNEEYQRSLISMRNLVLDHQLKREDLEWSDRDLAGGIVFTKSQTPLPSWQTLRPISFLATMLGDPDLTQGDLIEGEMSDQMIQLVESVRFLKQLVIHEEQLGMFVSPENALYGVRRSLWDQDVSIEASAMALLTLSETTRSFRQISDRMRD